MGFLVLLSSSTFPSMPPEEILIFLLYTSAQNVDTEKNKWNVIEILPSASLFLQLSSSDNFIIN